MTTSSVSAVWENECKATCPFCQAWNTHSATQWGSRVCDVCFEDYLLVPATDLVVHTNETTYTRHYRRERRQKMGPPPYQCNKCGKKYRFHVNFCLHLWKCYHCS